MNIEIPKRLTKEHKEKFAEDLVGIQNQIGFKVSARGWAYQLEQFGLVTKDQFDKVEKIINALRKEGYLPIDFIAEEEGRKFSGVEIPENLSPVEYMGKYLEATLECEKYYTPNWWEGEKYYIQMIVEKIDLKTLFEPVCKKYHICIATSKGWSSMLQRAEYAKRFKHAEEKGLICVLLYGGDHDPDGLRISDFLRTNLEDLANIWWIDKTEGYSPDDLIIERFGLNYDFIIENGLTWIDNLITGSGKNLASPSHKNYHMDYVQEYLRDIGEKKCEANALVVRPEQGRTLCEEVIINGSDKWGGLGKDALDRFETKKQKIRDILMDFRERTGIQEFIEDALEIINEEK